MRNVEIFPWNDRFDTGIPEIDGQHRELVSLLNRLVSHITSGGGNLEISAVFEELKRYAHFHFGSEESVWSEVFAGDAWAVEHEISHRRFTEDIVGMEGNRSLMSTLDMMKMISRYLAHWLALHILEHDHRMAKVVNSVRCGCSLEEAKAATIEEMQGPTRTMIDTILGMYDSLADRTLQLATEVNRRYSAEQHLMSVNSELLAKTQLIEERNAQLSAMFSLSPDGFIAFSREGTVTFVNPAFKAITGIDPAAILGAGEETFVRQLKERCDPNKAPLDFETVIPGADAEPVIRTVALSRPRRVFLKLVGIASDSRNIGNIVYLRDVTRESTMDQMRSEFLATAAHELRNPMVSIYGFSEVLMTQELETDTRKEIVEIIHGQSELMVSILNELLDLARIEARQGKDFHLQRLVIQDLLKAAIDGQYVPAGRKPPRLACPEAPIHVEVDREKFAQALMNVVSNAYKYSPGGGDVEISVECLPAGNDDEDSQTPSVSISVTDHGIGMSPEQTARVGERFYRADRTGSIPGTGLGMSIVKEILALQNGRFAIRSESGSGTTVALVLPCV